MSTATADAIVWYEVRVLLPLWKKKVCCISLVAQFIRICRWLQLIYKDRLAPLENAPFSTPWARKRCSVAQRFRQYLRATNCYKLSEGVYLVTTVDIADTDEVIDVIGDRLVELQVDEGLPIYVTPLRPIQRVIAELRQREQASSLSPLPLT